MKKIICCLFPFLLVAPIVSAAIAQTDFRADEAEVVVIPFRPPLGVDLVFDVSRHRPTAEVPKVTTMRQKIRFAEVDTGYVMTVAQVFAGSSDLNTEVLENTESKKLANLAMQPLHYDLDSDGTVKKIRNWDKVKDCIGSFLGDSATDQKMAAFFSRMSAEQAAAHFLKDWTAVLGYGGAELELDSEYEFDTALPFNNIMLPAIGSFRLSRNVENNILTLTEETKFKKKNSDEKAFLEFEKLAKGLFNEDNAKRLQFEETMRQLEQANVENKTNIHFDAETGLPVEAKVSRIMKLADGKELAIVTTVKQVIE